MGFDTKMKRKMKRNRNRKTKRLEDTGSWTENVDLSDTNNDEGKICFCGNVD